MDEDVSIGRILARGLRRRCPRCGEGPLFARWFTLHPACPACGLVYEERPGDNWAFWILGDRVFIALALVAVVLGFRSTTFGLATLFFVAVAVPLVATMPHRLGLCVSLDYLARRYFNPDP